MIQVRRKRTTAAIDPDEAEWLARHADFDHWVATVRDPAQAASEGARKLQSGRCHVEYEVAPLPDGRWALTFDCMASSCGWGTPWRAYGSRAACLAVFLDDADDWLREEIGAWDARKADVPHLVKLLALVHGKTPATFREPPPLPCGKYGQPLKRQGAA